MKMNMEKEDINKALKEVLKESDDEIEKEKREESIVGAMACGFGIFLILLLLLSLINGDINLTSWLIK